MKNQKGAVLGWVLVVMLVIMILVGTAISTSFGFYTRTVKRMDRKQTVYAASSVSSVIASEMNSGDRQQELVSLLLEEGGGISVEGMGEWAGTCMVTGALDSSGYLRITVTANSGEWEESITALYFPMILEEKERDEEETPVWWEHKGYYHGSGQGE